MWRTIGNIGFSLNIWFWRPIKKFHRLPYGGRTPVDINNTVFMCVTSDYSVSIKWYFDSKIALMQMVSYYIKANTNQYKGRPLNITYIGQPGLIIRHTLLECNRNTCKEHLDGIVVWINTKVENSLTNLSSPQIKLVRSMDSRVCKGTFTCCSMLSVSMKIFHLFSEYIERSKQIYSNTFTSRQFDKIKHQTYSE